MSTKSVKYKKGRIGVGGDSREKHDDRIELDGRNKVGGDKIDDNEVGNNKMIEKKNHQKIFKSKKL